MIKVPYGWGISGCCGHVADNPQFVTIRSLNGSGQELWQGDDGINPPAAVLLDQNGDVVTLHPNASLIKWSKAGVMLWKVRFNNDVNCMAIDGSNNIYVGGDASQIGRGERSIAKYDPNGNLLWIQNFLGNVGTIFWLGFQGTTLVSLDFDSVNGTNTYFVTTYSGDPSTIAHSSQVAATAAGAGLLRAGFQGSGTGVAAVQGSGIIVIGAAAAIAAQATISINSFWDGGTFIISVNGTPTAPIAWSLTPATTIANIQAAIAALPFVASCAVQTLPSIHAQSVEASRLIIGTPGIPDELGPQFTITGNFTSSFGSTSPVGSTPAFTIASFASAGASQSNIPFANTFFEFNDEISSGTFTITVPTSVATYVSAPITYSSDPSVLGPAIQSAMNAMMIIPGAIPPGQPPITFTFATSWTPADNVTHLDLIASTGGNYGQFNFNINITPKIAQTITSFSIANNSVRLCQRGSGLPLTPIPMVGTLQSTGVGAWNFAKIDIASGSTQWLQNTNDGQALSCVYVSPASGQIVLGASGPNVLASTVYVYAATGSPPALDWSASPQVTTNGVTSASTVSVAADNQGNFYSASGGAAFGFSSGGSELWTNHQGSVGFVICEQSVAPFYTQTRGSA